MSAQPITPCPCGGGCPSYKNGNQANSALRFACTPAPTVLFGHRSNDVRWVVDRRTNSKSAGGGMEPTVTRPIDGPAPTFTGKSGTQWVIRPERPSTTIVGSFRPEIVSAPGYRVTESRQDAEGGVRVTVAEGGVLQGFPPDYPWQGSKTAQFSQVGNAVPPQLAMHALSAVTGIPIPDGAA